MSAADPGAAPVPFHATPVSDPPPSRRILLISYVFPPSSSVGGLRWQKMSRQAVERGWGVDVVCLDPEDVKVSDPERLRDLPTDVRLYGVRETAPVLSRVVTRVWHAYRRVRAVAGGRPAPEGPTPALATSSAPKSIAREDVGRDGLKQRLRRTYFTYVYHRTLLDWARRATALAANLIDPSHQVIVASGPPHLAAQEAARLVAERSELPLVMDMRDPWSLIRRVSEPLASRLYFREAALYERLSVEAAALVVCNTDHAAEALRQLYPRHASRMMTVMNGSDDDGAAPAERDERFLIAYAGAIYWDRDPRPLFRAVSRVVRDQSLVPSQFGVHFMGVVGDYEGISLSQIARDEGIGEFVHLSPPSPRAAALRLVASAAMLVSLPQDSVLAIPSKVFEYSQYPAWLLALADPESATAALLRGTSADVIEPHDVNAIADAIRRRYLEHAAGVVPRPVDAEGRFRRVRQAALLLDKLDELTHASDAGGSAGVMR